MEKKGAVVIIEWVLLIGLTVALGIIVTTWMREQTKQVTEDIVEDVEFDARCADVSLNVAVLSCAPGVDHVNITNTGYFNITKVSVRNQFGAADFQLDLAPQSSKDLNIGNAQTEVDIVPVMTVGNKLFGCTDRKLIVRC